MRSACVLLALTLSVGCSHTGARSPPAVGPRVRPALALLKPPPAPDSYRSEVLANGMRISVVTDRSSSDVALRLFYHVGNADEAATEYGLAHLLEHLMFGATSRYKKGEYDAFIYRAGGWNNAMTTPDETVYMANLLPAQLGELLEREADRMQNLLLTQAALDNERRIITEELRLHEENSRIGRLGRTLIRETLRGHPYAHLAGTPETLAKLTLDQLRAFYARHYRPGNAHLVVVGCVDAEATLAASRQIFGGITKGLDAAPLQGVPSLREWKLALDVESKQDLAPGKAAVLAYPLPPIDAPDAWAVLLLRKILIETQTNLLHDDLVALSPSARAAAALPARGRHAGLPAA